MGQGMVFNAHHLHRLGFFLGPCHSGEDFRGVEGNEGVSTFFGKYAATTGVLGCCR